MSSAHLPFGSTIGIVGGGQLGRMSAMAAAKLGYRVHILSPEETSPASEVAADVTVGPYNDEGTLRRFASKVDVVTFEFENISAEGLSILESLKLVRPSRKILEISQDRIVEKTFLTEAGVQLAPWFPVRNVQELHAAAAALGQECILKTTRFGYDGKGQFRIGSIEDLTALGTDLPYPLVAEGVIDFDREISVMVVRGIDGAMRCFDVTENHHRNGILDLSLAPAPIPPQRAREAQDIARHIAGKIELVGIMGVEMFVDSQGRLLVNEIAPRPHNSGHWTMDACLCDQFDMHIRAVAGLPLPDPARHSDAAMKNLIGPEGMALCDAAVARPGLSLHLYGKNQARPGRKMGHVNAIFARGGLPGTWGLAAAFGPVMGNIPDIDEHVQTEQAEPLQ